VTVKGNAKYMFLPAAFVAAFVAFFSAQYLIDTFFLDVTLIDLGTFYVLGFISGLFVGLFLVFSRRGILEPPGG
jgi:predicted histidine transporter YuiF (NhaC family)